MSARRRFILFALSLAITFGAHVERVKASGIGGDRLVVTNLATGAILFDATTPELTPDGPSDTLFFGVTAPVFNGDPVRNQLTLTDPPGEPLGENPIFVRGTNLVASDVLWFVIEKYTGSPWIFSLFFYSDGSPQFEDFASNPSATLLEETGSLQDVTYLLHTDLVGWRVQLQSDVIPEPSTGVLAMMGMLGLAVWRRRRV